VAKIKLDKEERDILDSFERGEWRPVKNLKQEIQKHQEYARQTLKISSILHRFIAGRLVEKPRSNKSLETDV